MGSPNDFFTVASLQTFVGAVGATTVVANGVQRALDFNPKWLGLAVAEVVCLATVYWSHSGVPTANGSDYFIALVNGFLVYFSAAGATAAGARATGQSAEAGAIARGGILAANASDPARRRSFFSPWL